MLACTGKLPHGVVQPHPGVAHPFPSCQAERASPVAPSNGPHYHLLRQVILETLQPEGQGLRVAPYLVS